MKKLLVTLLFAGALVAADGALERRGGDARVPQGTALPATRLTVPLEFVPLDPAPAHP